LEGSVHTVKENAEALVVAIKDRNAGRGHSVKIDNSSIERVEKFKYLGATLTDQNSIQEEIKSRLKLLAIIRCRIFCLPGCYPES
jgi:predicted RNA-binding protein YlxR (DUF448 family)